MSVDICATCMRTSVAVVDWEVLLGIASESNLGPRVGHQPQHAGSQGSLAPPCPQTAAERLRRSIPCWGVLRVSALRIGVNVKCPPYSAPLEASALIGATLAKLRPLKEHCRTSSRARDLRIKGYLPTLH